MPLTINGELVDEGLLDAEFSQIKAHFEQQANVSCCERDDEFMGYARIILSQGSSCRRRQKKLLRTPPQKALICTSKNSKRSTAEKRPFILN